MSERLRARNWEEQNSGDVARPLHLDLAMVIPTYGRNCRRILSLTQSTGMMAVIAELERGALMSETESSEAAVRFGNWYQYS